MEGLTVGAAAARTGWSPRMLRYLEQHGLVVPGRSAGGYRALRARRAATGSAPSRLLRDRFGVGLDELAFAARLAPRARAARRWSTAGLPPAPTPAAWIDWEQRKHERLLAA